MGKLFVDRGWYQNRREESRKNPGGFDQNEVIKRSGVRNNRAHLHAESLQRFAIALEVFGGIFQFDASSLEEGIDLHGRREAEQASKLGMRNFLFAIGLREQGLPSSPGQILPLRGERFDKFVREVNRDGLHGSSLPKVHGESTLLFSADWMNYAAEQPS